MKFPIVVAALLAAFAMPAGTALAETPVKTVIVKPAVPTPPDASPARLEADKMVCRRPEAPIGTRFPGPRICKTQHQWDEEMRTEQHNIARSQTRGCLADGTCPR
jgi:hypothetical protein